MRVFAAVDLIERFRYFPRETQRFWCRKSGAFGVFDKLGVTSSSLVSPTVSPLFPASYGCIKRKQLLETILETIADGFWEKGGCVFGCRRRREARS
jgi:hypothetical protein